MTCDEAREELSQLGRGHLTDRREAEVRAHLEACEACARLAGTERVLTEVLTERLPHYRAPDALKQRLAAIVDGEAAVRPTARRAGLLGPALAVVGTLALAASVTLA